jgi:cytochrome c oxidase cbb3-type subunit 3
MKIITKSQLLATLLLSSVITYAQNTGTTPAANPLAGLDLVTWALAAGIVIVAVVILLLSRVMINLIKQGFHNKKVLGLLFLLSSTAMWAQTTPAPTPKLGSDWTAEGVFNAFILGAILVLFMVIAYLVKSVHNLLYGLELLQKPVQTETATQWIDWSKWTAAVPIEKEAAILTDHDYDGIRELDHGMPPFLKWIFYVTIAFGMVYLPYFQCGIGASQLEEYQTETKLALISKQEYLKNEASNVDENSVTQLKDDAAIGAGAEVFKSKCVACHGEKGEGTVGPNLTDDFWLHGGDIQSIFKTVKYGVPAKGMKEWQAELSPIEIQQVASFIKTLRGTNPPNPKEPQGTPFVEGAAAATDTTNTK